MLNHRCHRSKTGADRRTHGEPSTRGVTLKLPAVEALDFDDKVDEVADLLLAH